MSSLAPPPLGGATPTRQRYLSSLYRDLQRRGAQQQRLNAVFNAAGRSQNTYTVNLGRFAQTGAWRAGIDGRDFLRRPEWYQSTIEDFQPEKPDREGFIGRMWDRVNDGARVAQIGDIGWRAFQGRVPLDQAIEASERIRGEMSDLAWLENQKGFRAWFERNFGAGLEIAGMQLGLTKDAVSLATLWAAGGAAVGSAAPGLGTAAGGAGGFGTGMLVGMGIENVQLMAGLEFLDMAQMEIRLPDGTIAPMPLDVARAVAGSVGVVNGAIELVQLRTLGPTGIAAQRGLQRGADRVLRRMMRDGTLKQIATRAAVRALTAGGLEVVQEFTQETASEIGTEIALHLAENKTGGERLEAQQLGQRIIAAINEVGRISGGIAMLALPGSAVTFARDVRARGQLAADPERLFDRGIEGEMVPIQDVTSGDRISPRQRMLAERVVRAAAVSGGMPPIGVVEDASGLRAETVDDQAIIDVLRAYGFRDVRVARQVEEAAAGEPAADPGAAAAEPTPTAGEPPEAAAVQLDDTATPRDITAFDDLRQWLRDAAPTELEDRQVNAAAMLVENFARYRGLTLREFLEQAFPEGLGAADAEVAEQILAGQVPTDTTTEEATDEEAAPADGDVVQRTDRGTDREAPVEDVVVEDEPAPTEPPSETETEPAAAAEPASEAAAEDDEAEVRPARDEPPRPPEERAAADSTEVDPTRLTVEGIEEGRGSMGAIVAWEATDGTLHVVGGHGRAALSQRIREKGGDPFTVPARILREADGVTREQAEQWARSRPDLAGATVVEAARSLRGKPIEHMFKSLPFSEQRMRRILGLAALTDDVWAMVESGQLDPWHAAWIGALLAESPDGQRTLADAFVAHRPSTFTAEVRARMFRNAGMPAEERSINRVKAEILFRAMLNAPEVIYERAQALAGRGQALHAGAARERLNDQQIVGRALQYWIAFDQAAFSMFDTVAQVLDRGAEPTADQYREAAKEFLDFLEAKQDTLVPPVERPAADQEADTEAEPAADEQPTEEPTEEPTEAPEKDLGPLPNPTDVGPWKPTGRRLRMGMTSQRELLTVEMDGDVWWTDGGFIGRGEPPAYLVKLAGETRRSEAPPRFLRAIQKGPGDALGTPVFSYESKDNKILVDVFLHDGRELHVDARYVRQAWTGYREGRRRPTFHSMPGEEQQMIGVWMDDRMQAFIMLRRPDDRETMRNVRTYGAAPAPSPTPAPAPAPPPIAVGDRVHTPRDPDRHGTVTSIHDVRDHQGTRTMAHVQWGEHAAETLPLVQLRRSEEPPPARGTPEEIAAQEKAKFDSLSDERMDLDEREEPAPAPPEPGTAPAPAPPIQTTGAPPRPKPEIRVEDASAEDILSAIAEIDQGDAPKNILFQDRPAALVRKRRRLVRELVKRLLWDEGLHTFPAFADRIVTIWGDKPGADAIRTELRDWYEIARDVQPTWVGDMSTSDDIDRWYSGEAPDVPADRDGDREGEDSAGVRPDAEPGDAPGVGGRPEPPSDEGVPPEDREEPGRPATEGDREGDGDRGDTGGDRAEDRPAGSQPAVSNWAFGPGELTETERRGPVQKARDNVAAIETMQKVRREGRQPTLDEQRVLAKYVGWGGLAGAFPDSRGRFQKQFRAVGERLQELLSEREYELARRSIQYAHYTSEMVVSTMWKLARRLGFNGGNVLDPGSGTGNFAGLMPLDLAARAAYLGVELDPVTAAIARALYPDWSVRTADYTTVKLAEDTFALAIGNPPFGNITISDDRKYAKHKLLLHDYFFAKSIDSVRPNGLMVFISSAGTMNKRDSKAREFLAERADFLGGMRLPNITFKRNAGTEVTTDVLVFRKRPPGAEPNHVAPWVETVETAMVDRDGNQVMGRVNEYFHANPGQVLGEGGLFDELTAGLRYGVRPFDGVTIDDLPEHLDAAADRLVEAAPRATLTGDRDTEAPAPVDDDLGLADEDAPKKEGMFHVTEDGRLLQLRDDRLQDPMRRGSDGKYVKLTKAEQAKVSKLVPVRNAYHKVLRADLAEDADAAAAARAELTEAYDAFVSEFGPITIVKYTESKPTRVDQEKERRRRREQAEAAGEAWEEGTFDDEPLLNRKKPAGVKEAARARQAARDLAMRRGEEFDEGSFDPASMPMKVKEEFPNLFSFLADPESYRLMALEDGYDAETNTALKGAIFTRAIVNPPREAQIETAEDALIHIIGKTGGFDADAAAAAWKRSTRELVDALGEMVFFDPQAQTWVLAEEYLSGDVMTKLDHATDAAEDDPTLARNVEALRHVQPDPVPQSKISVGLGAPWIPTDDIRTFAEQIVGLRSVKVSYIAQIGQWAIESAASTTNQESNRIYGVNRGIQQLRTSTEVLSAALEQRPLKAPRIREGDRTFADSEGDRLAQEAVDKMRTDFKEWLWQDAARAERLVTIYNDSYNREVPRQFRSDYIKTPGVNASWKWYAHQLRVIARILMTGNTYMNHAVGAGKTSSMIAAAMELRRLGLANRPLFAVPKHVLSHFAAEWYHLYPDAKILVADEWNFSKARRQKFIVEASSGDYDAIVMSHDSFNMIAVEDEFMRDLIGEQIDELRAMLEGTDKEERFTRKQIERAIEKMERQLTALDEAPTDAVLTFEEIGADALFVDEAHIYRNLVYATSQQLKGLNPEGNQRSWRLFSKARYLDMVNPGRNVVFASGTPVTNSLAEIHTLQRYLDQQGLSEYGLQAFDSWAATFGDVENDLEPDVAGSYRYVDRFSRLKNQYHLFKLMMRFMDVVTPAQLREHVVVPELAGGEREQVYVDATESQQEFFDEAKIRMVDIRAGNVDPKEDNPLKLTTEGRQAAMDMRLLPGGSDVMERTKVELMIDRVYEIWRDSQEQPFYDIGPDGYSEEPSSTGPATQMIFSPFGYEPGTERLYLPSYLKTRLTAMGVPENEIAYIGDYDTIDRKRRLFREMNEGRIRILLGSEQGMGTGVNVQERLIALHSLGPLWHPAGDEQRIGRILRQGNRNKEVFVYDYSTIGSFDTFMWDLMRRKARGIEQFYRGDPDMEFIEDVSQQSLYQTASAMTTYDPRAMRLAELQQTIEKLTRAQGAAERAKSNAESSAIASRRRVAEQREVVTSLRADIAARQDISGKQFSIKFDGQTYTERPAANEAIQKIEELVTKVRVFTTDKRRFVAAKWDPEKQDWVPIRKEPYSSYDVARARADKEERRVTKEDERILGEFAGFLLRLEASEWAMGQVVLGRPGATGVAARPVATVELNQEGSILAKLEHAVRNLETLVDKAEADIEQAQTHAERMEQEAAKPLPSARELNVMIAEADALERDLAADEIQEQEGDEEPDVLQQLAVDDRYAAQITVGEDGRWRLAPTLADPLGLGDRTWGTAAEAAADIDAARERRRADDAETDVGDDQGDWLTDRLVERYGVTENPDEAGYVLWDGSLLRKPPPEARGGPNPATLMMATDAVRVDGKLIHAEGPLSEAQIAAILAQADEGDTYALLFSHRGQRIATAHTSPLLADTLRAFFSRAPVQQQDTARGAVMFDEANKAVIALSQAADFDTLIEELAHVFRRHMSADHEAVTGEWAGATRNDDGTWTWSRDAEERFARGVVQFLREREAPNDAVRTVFQRIAEWLRALYAGIRLDLTPEVRQAFEEMLIGEDGPEVATFERLKAAMGSRDQATFSDPDGATRLKVQRAGDGWVVDVLDENGHRIARRPYEDLDAALMDVAGLRTIDQPAPLGNARMSPGDRMPAAREMTAEEAELTLETDEMTLGEVTEAVAAEPEEQDRGGAAVGERLLMQDEREAGRQEARRAAMETTGGEVRPREKPQRPDAPTGEQTAEQLRGDVREAQAQATERTARRYEKRDMLRHGAQRIRQIHRDLVNALRDSRTLPEPLRTNIRNLAADLDLTKKGRVSARRMEPGGGQTVTDPLRLLAVLDEILQGDQHPGTLDQWGTVPLKDMSLLDLERLHRKVMATIHFVRDLQAEHQADRRRAQRVTVGTVIRELRDAQPAIRMPPGLRWAQELLGIASERPEYLLERIAGTRSELLNVFWRKPEAGIQTEREVGIDVRREFGRMLHDAGIIESWAKLEVWLNERIAAPQAVRHIKGRWTRGEVMSFALMWQDPYSRRMLKGRSRELPNGEIAEEGGLVVYDDVLKARPREGTVAHRITDAQAAALIGLLDARAKRIILGPRAPVRRLFERLYTQMNQTFRRVHGYDLEKWPSYYPVHIAQFAVPQRGEVPGDQLDFQYDPKAPMSPAQGMVQFRTRAMLPISLRAIGPEVNQAVSHSAAYIGLKEPLMTARAVIMNREVRAVLADKFGPATPEYLERYLQAVAHRYLPEDRLLGTLNALRQNVTVARLGLNPKVAISQSLSLALTSIYVPNKYVLQAIADMASPSQARAVRERHKAHDPNFAIRSDTGFDPDLRSRQAGKMTLPSARTGLRRRHDRVLQFAMKMVSGVDQWTVSRVEQAAVLHAMDALSTGKVSRRMADTLGIDDIAAVRRMPAEDRLALAYDWARFVVRRTQPSFLVENLSDLHRRPVARLWTSFSGYTNVAQNTLRSAYRDLLRYGVRDREALRGAVMATMSIVVIGSLGISFLNILQSMLLGREPEPLWKLFVGGVAALFFYVRDIAYVGLHLGRVRSMDNPTAEAIVDAVDAGVGMIRAFQTMDEDGLLRAMERMLGHSATLVGIPYWTAKNYVGAGIRLLSD